MDRKRYRFGNVCLSIENDDYFFGVRGWHKIVWEEAEYASHVEEIDEKRGY